MSAGIDIKSIINVLYDAKASNADNIVQLASNMLGKDVVESTADLRRIMQSLDRQTFPTPAIVRFSPSDVIFSLVNGIECAVDCHDISVSVHSANSGIYEPHLINCFQRTCKPGATVFDIGANIGFHTQFLSKLVGPNGHVYAFEPNSENCRLIISSSEHNQSKNITLLPVALSDQRGWAYFSSHIGSNGGFVSDQYVSLNGHGTIVPTFKLDDLSLPIVDFIKIDIEGAEFKALKGGEFLISRSRPVIVCEFSREMVGRVSGASPEDFLNWIISFDFKIFIIDRSSFKLEPVDSVSGLFEKWGCDSRIEDLLFLPREKLRLIGDF